MTPNDVKLALTEVLATGVSLTATAYVVSVLGWIVAGALGAFLGAYFTKRGETLAVQRDLDIIKRSLRETTAVTEKIKAQMSGDLWERQNRWTFKRDLYIKLLETLRVAYTAVDYLYDVETHVILCESAAQKKRFSAQQEKLAEALEEINRTTAVAALVLNDEGQSTLTQLDRELTEANNAENWFDCLEGRLAAIKTATVALKTAANADLVLEPRS